MTDILSQAEIDELLNALNSGELEPEEPKEETVSARNYDFRTANRFPKEQMRTLNIIFDNFAQLFTNRLGGILRTSCECELLSVEEISFGEFNNSLPSPVVLAILETPPLEGELIFEISPEAAYMVINRLLGGGSSKNPDNSKQFTEIELALVERVLQHSTRTFDEAWEKIFSVTSRVQRLETSPQFAQIVAINEAMAVATLEVRLGEDSGLISICIPHSSIESVSKQLNTRLLFSGAKEVKRVERNTEIIEERLIYSKVDVTARFEDTLATVSDIVNLQVGDVIRLNHNVNNPLTVKLQHISKFKAEIGSMGLNYAVQIVDIIKGENQDDNNVSG